MARERRTRMTCARVVPRNGTTGQLVARSTNPLLGEFGAERGGVVTRLYSGAAIRSVVGDVTDLLPAVRLVREYPGGRSSGSDGIVDRLRSRSLTKQMSSLAIRLKRFDRSLVFWYCFPVREVPAVSGSSSHVVGNPYPPEWGHRASIATRSDKIVCVLVGLPARGKSFIARRLAKYVSFFYSMP